MSDKGQGSGATVIPLRRQERSFAELVAGLIARDASAGDALVDQFGPKIDRRVWRLLGGDPEHADVVQQVFTRIVQTIATLKDPMALEAWIGRVTVSVVLGELRRRKYRRIVGFASSVVDQTPARDDLNDKIALRRGFQILDAMPRADRVIFVLRFIEGLSIPETAIAMSCSAATVKRRVRRAKERFLKRAAADPILAPLVQEEVEP